MQPDVDNSKLQLGGLPIAAIRYKHAQRRRIHRGIDIVESRNYSQERIIMQRICVITWHVICSKSCRDSPMMMIQDIQRMLCEVRQHAHCKSVSLICSGLSLGLLVLSLALVYFYEKKWLIYGLIVHVIRAPAFSYLIRRST